MTTELEKQLKKLALKSCDECSEFNYYPTTFKRMIAEKGAIKTIKELIVRREPSEGFTRLWVEKKLYLSAEALIAERPEFHEEFSGAPLETARKRLKACKYELVMK